MAKEMDYFASFCRVAKAFGTTQSQAELLDLIVRSATETMDAKAACLFLADREQDVFVPVASTGLSDRYLQLRPYAAERLVAETLKEGYLAVRDATTDERVELRDDKLREGIASMLLVPVIVQDHAIGVLSLYTEDPRDFARQEIDFLAALAEQGGIAIERARLLERMRKNTQLFLRLAAEINASLDIKSVMENLTGELCRTLDIQGVIIRLLNKETGELEYVASYGLSEKFLNKGPVLAEAAVEQALKGEIIVIEDVRTDARIQYPREVAEEGIHAMILAPIPAKEEVIGVMRLCSSRPIEYLEDTKLLVNALAQTGGLAIQNASLLLALEENIKDLEEDFKTQRSWF